MVDPTRALAAVLFLQAAMYALDVYSAVNSSPWTAENVTAGDPEKEASLKRYCLHAIGQNVFVNAIAAVLANGLWWAVVLGATIEVVYMSWLYFDAVRRGRKAKNASQDFSQNWSSDAAGDDSQTSPKGTSVEQPAGVGFTVPDSGGQFSGYKAALQ